MKNFILPLRYVFFVSFVICNAIISSTAIWNLGLAQAVGRQMTIDVYLALVSAGGLLFYFAIATAELIRKDIITAKVWFECIWVGGFFLFELIGAVAMTVVAPFVMCQSKVTTVMDTACTSTRVVLVFSWTVTLITLIYCVILCSCAFRCYRKDPSVWDSNVHLYRWSDMSSKMGSPPISPTLPFHRSNSIRSIKSQDSKSTSTSVPSSRAPSPPRPRPPISSPLFKTPADDLLPPPPRAATAEMRQMSHPFAASYYAVPVAKARPLPIPPTKSQSGQSLWNSDTLVSLSRKRTETHPTNDAFRQARSQNTEKPPQASSSKMPSERRTRSEAPLPQVPVAGPEAHRPKAQTWTRTTTQPIPHTPTTPRKPSGDWRNRVVVPPPLDLSKISANRPSTRVKRTL